MTTQRLNIFVLTAVILCGVLFCTNLHARVCFVTEGNCAVDGGNFGSPDIDKDTENKCRELGYTETGTEACKNKIAYTCPYSAKWKKCCGLEYKHSFCAGALIPNGICHNKYKCVCRSEYKYHYSTDDDVSGKEKCGSESYPYSLPGGGSCVQEVLDSSGTALSAQTFFRKCVCGSYYAINVEECEAGGAKPQGEVCKDSSGGRWAFDCACDRDKYPYSEDGCGEYLVDRLSGKCEARGITYYKSCRNCDDYPAQNLDHVAAPGETPKVCRDTQIVIDSNAQSIAATGSSVSKNASNNSLKSVDKHSGTSPVAPGIGPGVGPGVEPEPGIIDTGNCDYEYCKAKEGANKNTGPFKILRCNEPGYRVSGSIYGRTDFKPNTSGESESYVDSIPLAPNAICVDCDKQCRNGPRVCDEVEMLKQNQYICTKYKCPSPSGGGVYWDEDIYETYKEGEACVPKDCADTVKEFLKTQEGNGYALVVKDGSDYKLVDGNGNEVSTDKVGIVVDDINIGTKRTNPTHMKCRIYRTKCTKQRPVAQSSTVKHCWFSLRDEIKNTDGSYRYIDGGSLILPDKDLILENDSNCVCNINYGTYTQPMLRSCLTYSRTCSNPAYQGCFNFYTMDGNIIHYNYNSYPGTCVGKPQGAGYTIMKVYCEECTPVTCHVKGDGSTFEDTYTSEYTGLIGKATEFVSAKYLATQNDTPATPAIQNACSIIKKPKLTYTASEFVTGSDVSPTPADGISVPVMKFYGIDMEFGTTDSGGTTTVERPLLIKDGDLIANNMKLELPALIPPNNRTIEYNGGNDYSFVLDGGNVSGGNLNLKDPTQFLGTNRTVNLSNLEIRHKFKSTDHTYNLTDLVVNTSSRIHNKLVYFGVSGAKRQFNVSNLFKVDGLVGMNKYDVRAMNTHIGTSVLDSGISIYDTFWYLYETPENGTPISRKVKIRQRSYLGGVAGYTTMSTTSSIISNGNVKNGLSARQGMYYRSGQYNCNATRTADSYGDGVPRDLYYVNKTGGLGNAKCEGNRTSCCNDETDPAARTLVRAFKGGNTDYANTIVEFNGSESLTDHTPDNFYGCRRCVWP